MSPIPDADVAGVRGATHICTATQPLHAALPRTVRSLTTAAAALVARYRYWYGVSDPVRWTADFETFAHRALNRTARAEHYRIAHPHALPAGAITGDGSVMLGYDPDAPALLRHLLPQARTASR